LNEQIEKFSKSFSLEHVQEFIDFVSETNDNFLNFMTEVDKFDRNSDEFQNITKYHSAAMKTDGYRKIYNKIVKMASNKEEIS